MPIFVSQDVPGLLTWLKELRQPASGEANGHEQKAAQATPAAAAQTAE